MTKIYAIYGYTTAPIRIPAGDGKAYIEVEFTRGRPGAGANSKPATYCSVSKTEQDIIEHSPFFNRLIKLYRVYGDAPATSPAAASQPVAAPAAAPVAEEDFQKPVEQKVFPEVTSYDQAVSVLKGLGAKATSLRSVAAIQKAMVNMGVTFPNYSFE